MVLKVSCQSYTQKINWEELWITAKIKRPLDESAQIVMLSEAESDKKYFALVRSGFFIKKLE